MDVSSYYPLYIGFNDFSREQKKIFENSIFHHDVGSLAQLKFCFLNQSRSYSDDVNWHDQEVSQLWRYNLHYFEYVRDILSYSVFQDDNSAWELFRRLTLSWINGNSRLQGDGWHPFTISIRLVNWFEAYCFWRDRFHSDLDFENCFLASMHAQAFVLASSLEHDVRGNHLIKNLRALIWVGIAFDDEKSGKWFTRAMGLLKVELAEQILEDGGHFERTPGYHAVVLQDCLEIAVMLRRNCPDGAPLWLEDTLKQMFGYFNALLPRNNLIPLFKDTAWDVAPFPEQLLAAGAVYFNTSEFKVSDLPGTYPFMIFGAEAKKTLDVWTTKTNHHRGSALESSGYFIMRDSAASDYMLIDAGKVCPNYLPAHAHADMFSYELTVRGRRVVVDSGVFEYKAGAWRDYFRSTRAHNTVEINSENQSEVWGSFRVARRANVFDVKWDSREDRTWFQARHDGYKRLKIPAVHRRVVVWEKGLFWLIIDELSGKGSIQASNHIHLAPDIIPEKVEDSFWRLNGLPFPFWVHAFGNSESLVTSGQIFPFIQGWYSDKFGIREPNNVISLKTVIDLPFIFGYALTSEDKFYLELLHQEEGAYMVHVKAGGHAFNVLISPQDVKYNI